MREKLTLFNLLEAKKEIQKNSIHANRNIKVCCNHIYSGEKSQGVVYGVEVCKECCESVMKGINVVDYE